MQINFLVFVPLDCVFSCTRCTCAMHNNVPIRQTAKFHGDNGKVKKVPYACYIECVVKHTC